MMRQIVRLIAKDFAIQKKTFKSYVLVALFMGVFFSFMDMDQKQMVMAVVAFPIIYGFINRALYEDEKNNSLRLLAALPMRKQTIVYARYLSTAFMILLVTLLSWLVNRILVSSGIWTENSMGGNLILLATILFFALMISVYLPLAFKLGYIKAANLNRFLFIGIFAFFGAATAILSGLFKGEPPKWVGDLERLLSSMSLDAFLVGIVLVVILVYLLSMRLSIRLFNKRNLF